MLNLRRSAYQSSGCDDSFSLHVSSVAFDTRTRNPLFETMGEPLEHGNDEDHVRVDEEPLSGESMHFSNASGFPPRTQ